MTQPDKVTWSFLEPFGVDNGELDSVPPHQAFTLGVEWEMFRQRALRDEEFHGAPVHTDNRRRIEALLSRHGYWQRWDVLDDWSVVTALREPPE